jgi:hypothetical protein
MFHENKQDEDMRVCWWGAGELPVLSSALWSSGWSVAGQYSASTGWLPHYQSCRLGFMAIFLEVVLALAFTVSCATPSVKPYGMERGELFTIRIFI